MAAQVEFERARSTEAKQAREQAILAAAALLASARGVRSVTLTDIAAEVGMHKSAMLRYFETREQIFLSLSSTGWAEWSAAVRVCLDGIDPSGARDARIAAASAALAGTLADRPLFCDLLAHTPLNLERNVSLESARAFKLGTLAEVAAIGEAIRRVVPLGPAQAKNVVATATSMAGALWQMAAPGTELRRLYETDPELAHAVVEVEPRLGDILSALMRGYCAS